MTARRRVLGVGLGVAGAYVVLAVATVQLSSRPFRPLFDGFAPPVPYCWVEPPPELAADNCQAEAVEVTLGVGEQGSDVATATTPDNQAVAGVEAGSVAAHPPDTEARISLTPFEAGIRGPLPPDRTPQSNAYRVSIAYQPSGEEVTTLARPGSLALTAAGPADELLYSPDGERWERREARPLGQGHGLSTALEATGWYVVVSTPPPVEEDDSGGPNVVLVVAAVAVVPLVLAWLLLGRGKKPATRSSGRRPAGGRPPPRPRPGSTGRSATKPKPKARKKRKPPPKRRR